MCVCVCVCVRAGACVVYYADIDNMYSAYSKYPYVLNTYTYGRIEFLSMLFTHVKDGVGADVCCFYLIGQTVQMLQQRWHAIVTRELGFKNLDEMQVC